MGTVAFNDTAFPLGSSVNLNGLAMTWGVETISLTAGDNDPVVVLSENTAGDTLISYTIPSGYGAGTYTQRATDGAPLTFGMVTTAPVPLKLPSFAADPPMETVPNEVQAAVWLYAGADFAVPTWTIENTTDGQVAGFVETYTPITDDVGDQLRIDATFGGVMVSSVPSSVVTAGVPPFPDAFTVSDWAPTTGSVATPNSILLGISSLPNDNGDPITDIQYDVDGDNNWQSTGTSTAIPVEVPMVAPETSYAIRLRARNSTGIGEAGDTQNTISGAGVPNAVTVWDALTGPGDSQITIEINAEPHDNGAQISDYEYITDDVYEWASLGTNVIPLSVPVTLSNPGATYSVIVRAINAVGEGGASAPEIVESGGATGPFNPEDSLNLTSSHAIGAIPDATFADQLPCVFAADFTALVNTGNTMIWTQGADGQCSSLYYESNGDLILRAGEGFSNVLPNNDNASIRIPAAEVPTDIGTIVWEVTPGLNTVRIWIDAIEYLNNYSQSTQSQRWGWTANGGWLNSPSGAPDWLPNSVTPYTTASQLRYYENQQVTT